MLVMPPGCNWKIKNFWITEEEIFSAWMSYTKERGKAVKAMPLKEFADRIKKGQITYMYTPVKVRPSKLTVHGQ